MNVLIDVAGADVIQQPVTPKLKVPRKLTKNKGRRQINNNIRRYSDDEDSESFLDEEESDEGHNNNNNNNNNNHHHHNNNRRVYKGYSDEEDFTESVFEDEGEVDFASSWAGEDDGDYRPTSMRSLTVIKLCGSDWHDFILTL
jgi:hypothetical protein